MCKCENDIQPFLFLTNSCFLFSNVTSSGKNWHIACHLCSVVPWRPMIHCWVMQHELLGLFNCSWMWSSTEMCYIFPHWYTLQGDWEKKETSGVQVQGVTAGWKSVFFPTLGLPEKYLQFSRGTVMIQVQTLHVLFPVVKYWLFFIAADGWNTEMQAVLEGTSECMRNIWNILSPVDQVATSSFLIRTSRGFRSNLPVKLDHPIPDL